MQWPWEFLACADVFDGPRDQRGVKHGGAGVVKVGSSFARALHDANPVPMVSMQQMESTIATQTKSDVRLTIDEFLAFYETRPDGEKWELIEGVARMSPTPTDAPVLFELLSPSNTRSDQVWRRKVYASGPNSQHYVTVSQSKATASR